MKTETHTIIIKRKEDVTKQLMAQLKDEYKDTCAGTFHKFGDCEYPCISGGMLVKSYEQQHYEATHEEHKEAVGLLRDMVKEKQEQLEFGDPNPSATVETVVCRPLTLAPCPCRLAAKISDFDKQVMADLGVETLPKLYDAQKAGFEAFTKRKASLFIYGESGGGKTVLAAACAIGFHRKVKVLVGDEISAEWRRKAFDNQSLDYEGLLILDDLDKTMPTDSFKEKLWYIFDRVAKKKLRLIITTNLSPEAFAEKYTSGKDEAQSMVTRITKFEAVEL